MFLKNIFWGQGWLVVTFVFNADYNLIVSLCEINFSVTLYDNIEVFKDLSNAGLFIIPNVPRRGGGSSELGKFLN